MRAYFTGSNQHNCRMPVPRPARAYQPPGHGPLPDLPLYERLIGDGIVAADGRGLPSTMSPPGRWPSGWPPAELGLTGPDAIAQASQPPGARTASTNEPASTPTPEAAD